MTADVDATVLAGAPLAAEIREGVRKRIALLRERGIVPGLSIVTVGEPPSGNPYVRAKCRAAEEVGARATVTRLAPDVSESAVRATLREISADRSIHGVILQLPIPAPLRDERHLEDIDPEKDVDGIHPLNVGRWVNGLTAHRPATPLGIVELLRRHAGDLAGKHAVVVGRSRIVGRPLSVFLSERSKGMNATVTLCHSETRDLPSHTARADILIVAMGRRRAIGTAEVRPGAVVIDVGIHPVEHPVPGGPKYEGDVDYEAAHQ